MFWQCWPLFRFILFFVPAAPHFSLSLFIEPILWPYSTLCSCLPICLAPSQAFGNPFCKEKEGRSLSGYFLLGRDVIGALGSRRLLSVRVSLDRGSRLHGTLMAACASVFRVLMGWYPCRLTIWRFICCILEETNLTKRLKIYGLKISKSRKAITGPRKGVSQQNQDQILVLKSHQSNPPEAPFM